LSPKKGAILPLKNVALDFILSPIWRQIAPSGHPESNPTILGKSYWTLINIKWPSFMMQPWNSQETSLINLHLTNKLIV